MIVGAGGGFGVLFLIFDVLVLMSLGASFCYLKWRGRYKRNQQPVPPLKKWQLAMLYGPMILLISCVIMFYKIMESNEKYVAFEREKDKNRYFTIEKDTPYGEIILPKGTHINKNIPQGYEHNAPRDLNDVDAIGFPHPVMINGMAVIEISTTIGYLRLAEDYHFIHKGQKTVCPKTHYLVVDLNDYDLRQPYFMNHQPIPPEIFKPSLWTFRDCSFEIDFPSNMPYWKDGKLINLD